MCINGMYINLNRNIKHCIKLTIVSKDRTKSIIYSIHNDAVCWISSATPGLSIIILTKRGMRLLDAHLPTIDYEKLFKNLIILMKLYYVRKNKMQTH